MTHPEPDLLSGEELGRWLGLSGKEVYDLGKAGVLVRVGRAYRLEDSVRRYCEHLRRTATAENVDSLISRGTPMAGSNTG